MTRPKRPSTFIYVIGPESVGPVKVGIAGNLNARLSQMQTGSPVRLIVHHYIRLADGIDVRDLEQTVHKLLDASRSHGEWFNVLPSAAWDAVQSVCVGLPINTATTTASASDMKATVHALHPLGAVKL